MEIPRVSQHHQGGGAQQQAPVLGAQPPLAPQGAGGYGHSGGVPRLPLQAHDRAGNRQIQQNKSRRLYVGNIPFHVGISENGMVQLFSALYVAGFRAMAPGEALPVSSFWLHSDGKFGFMELRGDQEAVDCMQFNGVVLHGRPLRVNRPSDYRPEMFGTSHLQPSPCNVAGIRELCAKLEGIVGPPAQLAAQAAALPPAPLPAPAASSQTNGVADGTPTAGAPGSAQIPSQAPAASAGSGASGGPPVLRSQPQTAGQTESPAPPARSGGDGIDSSPRDAESAPTRPSGSSEAPPDEPAGVTVVSLQHMVTDEDLDGPAEEYDDLVEDVREESKSHGKLTEVSIPRSGKGRGSVFLAYATPEDAERALSNLKELVFNGKAITGVIIPNVANVKEAVEKN